MKIENAVIVVPTAEFSSFQMAENRAVLESIGFHPAGGAFDSKKSITNNNLNDLGAPYCGFQVIGQI